MHACTPRALAVPLALALALPSLAAKPAAPVRAARAVEVPAPPDVPYAQFRLDNGLTVIVHEDRDAPIVAVYVWYRVGSKDEKPGKTGFAHLFEHLMFNGSENHDDDWFKVFDRMGATSQNGTTNTDRTNYFQNVPVSALETTLWLESDRMGHLLGAIDQAKLDEQRGVVQNEKRQGENQPYGTVFQVMAKNTYPEGHPYSWTTIGSMEDLNAATLDDVKEWFRTWYGPDNAILVLAGDITPERARELTERYFGDIPPGPPLVRQESWPAQRTGEQRMTMSDRVPQGRVYMSWNVPERSHPDTALVDLATDVLGGGKTSRLFERLVHDEKTATQVQAGTWGRLMGSQASLTLTAQPGGDLDALEKATREELALLLEKGPSADELERIKLQRRAQMVRGIERVGGFGGKADLLASSLVYFGSPDGWKIEWEREQSATPEQVRDAARRWLSDGAFVLHVTPLPQLVAAKSGADRSKMPEPGTPPAPSFPAIQRATLKNGVKVVLAEMHHTPQVTFNLLVDAGTSADAKETAGLATLALDMMDEGTASLDALQLADRLERLGANLSTDSNSDMSGVSVSALVEQLDPSLDLWADVVLRPAFRADDFERLKKQRLARIGREKVEASSMVGRVLPELLFGEGHAYANSASGTGTEQSVGRLTRDDAARFHATWFKPGNATVVVVGDTTLADAVPRLERVLGGWAPGEAPKKNVATVSLPSKPRLFLMDRPGAVQSLIVAAHVAPPKSSPDDLALIAMNNAFGGGFTSRLNLNLREDKSWSYGSRANLDLSKGQRVLAVNAPVQTDKTKESVAEIVKEIAQIRGPKPITEAELDKVKDLQTLPLVGRWETISSVASSIAELVVRCGMPDDYWNDYSRRVRALTVSDVNRAAAQHLRPEALTWFVVGDRSKIEAGLRESGIAELVVLGPDGRPAEASAVGQ